VCALFGFVFPISYGSHASFIVFVICSTGIRVSVSKMYLVYCYVFAKGFKQVFTSTTDVLINGRMNITSN